MNITSTSDFKALKKLIQEINGDAKNILAKCISAGERLTKLKEQTKHGDWRDVLDALEISETSARRYMGVWESRARLDLSKVKSLSDAYEFLDSKPSKSATVAHRTSQNEPLTNEKSSTSDNQKTLNVGRNSDGNENHGTHAHEDEKKEPEIQRDKVGRPIPEGILELWNRAHETGTKLRSMVSEVKCVLDKGIKKDKIFAEIIDTVVSNAEALHFELSQLIPYAVCPTCQGKTPDRCATCRHRGYISKTYWDGPAVDSGVRNLIKRQYASQTISA